MSHSCEARQPCLLVIGGLDPSGGAGLLADARAAGAFGVHACTVATAIVAQNTRGVTQIEAVSTRVLLAQLDALWGDIVFGAIKIGMLPGVEAIETIASRLRSRPAIPIILDTVLAPSSGPSFLDDAAIEALGTQLLPLCQLVTPNIPEAARLTGLNPGAPDFMAQAARAIHSRWGARQVLVKGGHGQGDEAVDVLFDGSKFVELRARRVEGFEVRGTGCLLASAIAAQMARSVPVAEAVREAKEWLTWRIQAARVVGGGRRMAG